ncbi:MAG: hypothetical protein K8T10_03360 [Candidatus Eremiobacteraeota bacterium]|nr:hypothetical protein [Candidatus Eremiobacteraeota bacterium]
MVQEKRLYWDFRHHSILNYRVLLYNTNFKKSVPILNNNFKNYCTYYIGYNGKYILCNDKGNGSIIIYEDQREIGRLDLEYKYFGRMRGLIIVPDLFHIGKNNAFFSLRYYKEGLRPVRFAYRKEKLFILSSNEHIYPIGMLETSVKSQESIFLDRPSRCYYICRPPHYKLTKIKEFRKFGEVCVWGSRNGKIFFTGKASVNNSSRGKPKEGFYILNIDTGKVKKLEIPLKMKNSEDFFRIDISRNLIAMQYFWDDYTKYFIYDHNGKLLWKKTIKLPFLKQPQLSISPSEEKVAFCNRYGKIWICDIKGVKEKVSK